jgi:hypothetical protein
MLRSMSVVKLSLSHWTNTQERLVIALSELSMGTRVRCEAKIISLRSSALHHKEEESLLCVTRSRGFLVS